MFAWSEVFVRGDVNSGGVAFLRADNLKGSRLL